MIIFLNMKPILTNDVWICVKEICRFFIGTNEVPGIIVDGFGGTKNKLVKNCFIIFLASWISSNQYSWSEPTRLGRYWVFGYFAICRPLSTRQMQEVKRSSDAEITQSRAVIECAKETSCKRQHFYLTDKYQNTSIKKTRHWIADCV